MGTTPNYGWTYPTVNADADTWGTKLNNMAIAIDASLKTVDNGLAARLVAANNLSDLSSASTARTNLGLGTISTFTALGAANRAATINSAFTLGTFPTYTSDGSLADSGFQSASFCKVANNLSDISASVARTNLGLGSIATHNVTISSSAPSGGADGDIWFQYA